VSKRSSNNVSIVALAWLGAVAEGKSIVGLYHRVVEMNLDLEQSAPLRRRGPRPEGNDDAMPMIPPPPPGLPPRHPLQLMKRTAIMGGTLYAMHGK